MLAPAGSALAQTAQPPTAAAPVAPRKPQSARAPAAPPAAPPPSRSRRNRRRHSRPRNVAFSTILARWWDKSIADFDAKMKDQQSKLDDFNKDSATATQDAMKSAFDAVHPSRLVEMHEVCATAGNGAPIARPAVTNACRAKGFKCGDRRHPHRGKMHASLWVSDKRRRQRRLPGRDGGSARRLSVGRSRLPSHANAPAQRPSGVMTTMRFFTSWV